MRNALAHYGALTFLFNVAATPEIYTLSLHDALPISDPRGYPNSLRREREHRRAKATGASRSEEHTSELQSRENLVCRHLLEKKNGTADLRAVSQIWKMAKP